MRVSTFFIVARFRLFALPNASVLSPRALRDNRRRGAAT